MKTDSLSSPSESHQNRLLELAGWGVFLLLVEGAIALLSSRFAYERPRHAMPILWVTALMAAAGVGFLLLVFRLRRFSGIRNAIPLIFLVGILMRLLYLPSTAILEDDWYRYLWDGAAVAQGENPYRFSPLEIQQDSATEAAWGSLAEEGAEVLARVNHPELRSIYPPVAEGAFALAHIIAPWKLWAWRLVLHVVDCINFLLLFLLTKQLALSPLLLSIYWWNPLLIKEIFNSGHMDILLFPFILLAVRLYGRRQFEFSGGMVTLAAGVKLWPIALLPLALKPIIKTPGRLLSAVFLSSAVAIVLAYPIITAGFDSSSGFAAYSQRWEMNDAFFVAVVWVYKALLPLFKLHPGHAQFVGRVTVAAILLVWIGQQFRSATPDARKITEKILYVAAAVFLLSPTQYPWYYVWLLPFLALHPRRSLLMFTPLLPLYYLRYYLLARGQEIWFDRGVVWLEYLPVWIWLLVEWRRSGQIRENPDAREEQLLREAHRNSMHQSGH